MANGHKLRSDYVGMLLIHSSLSPGSELDGAVDEIGHVVGGLERKRMMRETGPGRDM
jgi:hypothetical protein